VSASDAKRQRDDSHAGILRGQALGELLPVVRRDLPLLVQVEQLHDADGRNEDDLAGIDSSDHALHSPLGQLR
jgi:hypothetical protein